MMIYLQFGLNYVYELSFFCEYILLQGFNHPVISFKD